MFVDNSCFSRSSLISKSSFSAKTFVFHYFVSYTLFLRFPFLFIIVYSRMFFFHLYLVFFLIPHILFVFLRVSWWEFFYVYILFRCVTIISVRFTFVFIYFVWPDKRFHPADINPNKCHIFKGLLTRVPHLNCIRLSSVGLGLPILNACRVNNNTLFSNRSRTDAFSCPERIGDGHRGS